MTIVLIYTNHNIFSGVKAETSLLAARRFRETTQGEASMFDELVFDEEYEVMFKRLFSQAHAEVMKYIPPQYIDDTPTDIDVVYREFADFSQEDDWVLYLGVQGGFIGQYRKSIDIKIEQFLIDYICWRWLETKSPTDAIFYLNRLEPTMRDVLRLLARRGEPVRRIPNFP